MSWLKKSTYGLGKLVGKVDSSVDEEFDTYKAEFEKEKKYVVDVQKDIKALIGHFHALSSALTVFSGDIAQVYKPNDPVKEYLAQFSAIVENFEETAFHPYSSRLKQGCIARLEEYHKEMHHVKKLMSDRDDKKLNYDGLYSSVKRMVQNPNTDPIKLQKEKDKRNIATTNYNNAAIQAKQSLVDILDGTTDVYDPVLIELCNATAEVCHKMASSFSKLGNIAEEVKRGKGTFGREKREVTAPVKVSKMSGGGEEARQKRLESAGGRKNKRGPPPPRGGPKINPVYLKTEWYYLDDNVQQQGPFDFGQLKRLFQSSVINAGTHVFGGDLADWKTVGEVPGLVDGFKN